MNLKERLKALTPDLMKKLIRPVRALTIKKSSATLAFWKSRYIIDHGHFINYQYRELMLAMAEETSDVFLTGKIVADFGCGPRGSLVWAQSALLRVGIDVLADRYADLFTDNMISHGMIYLKSTEKIIPLPSDFIDVMFTLNAMDHVDDFPSMCREILRVIKPGGLFIGSFNLGEPPTPSEPQRLDEEMIKYNLIDKLELLSYRITKKGPVENIYSPFFNGNLTYRDGQEGILWIRAKKPGEVNGEK